MTEEDAQDTTTQESIALLNQLKQGKKLYDKFALAFKSKYLIAGSLIAEWKAHFKVKLPPDLNPQTCQAVDSKLMDLHQEASFLKAEAEARLSACKSANDDKYRTRYASLVAEYKAKGSKLPAKDTLGALAEHAIQGTKSAQTHAEIELTFWKDILSDLANCRKLVDNATINLSVEAKALSNAKYLDSLNKNRNL